MRRELDQLAVDAEEVDFKSQEADSARKQLEAEIMRL